MLAQGRPYFGEVLGEHRAESHLVGEVDEVPLASGLSQFIDEVRELDAGDRDSEHLPRPRSALIERLDLLDFTTVKCAQHLRLETVLGEFGIEGAHILHNCRDRGLERREVAGGRGDDPVGELDRGSLGEQSTAGLDP
ncbi:unannotated protein [freshwater metagenome]|uniref:Unannotated protein n=1 Tax=freshwater metagenome TaxID=449393 RepID=A0A6J7C2K3_9ZZZZ